MGKREDKKNKCRKFRREQTIESGNFNTKKTKKQNGLMKNETEWHEPQEIVCLSPKCYSILVKYFSEMKQKMTAKGVKSNLHKDLQHILYKKVAGVLNQEDVFELNQLKEELEMVLVEIGNNRKVTGKQKTISSDKQHQLHTLELNKVLLNNFNDKRYDDLYAYGHYRTKTN